MIKCMWLDIISTAPLVSSHTLHEHREHYKKTILTKNVIIIDDIPKHWEGWTNGLAHPQ
jgi:hypothetical protein